MADNPKLEKLKAARAVLDARIQQTEARAKTAVRKQDTRKKIIIGGTMLAAMDENPDLARMVITELAKRVTKAKDRAILGGLVDSG